ncbi:MAG: putative ATPase [Chthonomonadaceae bacterium]|nr:putative ATPase [Chthonomonadaceae bacterium]
MNLPGRTMTFLFTDIEGSSKLWEEFPETVQPALSRHDALLCQAVETQGGHVFKMVGDGVYAAFATAPEALAAALTAQKAICSETWPIPMRVRMALHTGMAEPRGDDYAGASLNRVSRLLSVCYGGQVLLSASTQELTRDHLPPQSSLRDLGEVRLRDLARPEHVFQLLHAELPADFPPVKSCDNPDCPNNLPRQVTSLVGRKKESAEVVSLLQTSPLLTLTGAGGCGKTRLAIQVAGDLLENYPDGVWFIELAPLTEAALIPQTVAQIFRVQEEVGKSLMRSLIQRLDAQRMLLVLDNCEHLLAAAATFADALLRSLPQIRLLATSREALTIGGERIYRVPSLSLPEPQQTQTPESVVQCEAVQLFIDRALAVAPGFTVTKANAPALAAICLRLDGIPLALELAAARSRSLPLEQIAGRLDHCFHLLTGGSRTALPRQQTLRALIDWSFCLLAEAEQNLFCRLSVFSGGWTLEAAEAICRGDGLAEWEILDLLTSLVDKSLVVYAEWEGAPRYRLLETVRQYAGGQWTERGGDDTLRVRHRDYYLTLAKQSLPQGKDAPHHLTLLESEHDNLRAALSASFGDPDSVEQMLGSLKPIIIFRRIRGYYSEARDSLQAALAAEGKGRTTARVSVLGAAALTNMALGHYEDARRQSEESVKIQRELDEPLKLAAALMNHSNLLVETGHFMEGRCVLEEGLEIHLAHGGSGVGFYGNLGNALLYLGEYDQAEILIQKHLALCRQEGMQEWEAVGVYNLGLIALACADYATSYTYMMQSLEIRRALNDRTGLLSALFGLSLLAAALKRQERACRLLGAHDALNRRIGSCLAPADQPNYDRHRAAVHAALGAEAFSAAYEAGCGLDWSQAIALAVEDMPGPELVA